MPDSCMLPISVIGVIAYPACAQKPREPSMPGKPLGVLQLLVSSVELDSSDACFLLLKAGAQWGRSTTQPCSKQHAFDWEARGPLGPSVSPVLA